MMVRGLVVSAAFLLLAMCCGTEGSDGVVDCGSNPADILFILDESGSVGIHNFAKKLLFVNSVVNESEVGPFHTQFAVLTFSGRVRKQFYFNKHSNKEAILENVSKVGYKGGGTRTHLALKAARDEFFTPARGMRVNAAHIAIVITDGISNNKTATAIEAQRLRDKGIIIFSVGVGEGPNLAELNTIATDPDKSHVFYVTDFDSLNDILGSLRQGACEAKAAFLCSGRADVIFLLDMSTVFSEDDLKNLIQFVTGIADTFIVGSNDVQIGVDTFSADFSHKLYLKDNAGKVSFESALSSISYTEGTSAPNTGNALKMMRETSFAAEAGNRENVAKVAIVVTNGNSNNKALTSSEAQKAKDAGITILAVGIGQGVDDAELDAIASGQNVYKSAAFDTLYSLEEDVAAQACGEVEQQPPPLDPQATETGADIVFVLDSSGSVGEHDFRLLLSFVNNIIQDLDIGLDSIRVGVVTFNNRPRSSIHLNTFDEKAALMNAVMDIEYREGGNDIAAAIKHMDNVMFTTANGDRPGVPNIGIIITDGKSEDPEISKLIAQTVKDNGIRIFVIGVGFIPIRDDLYGIASYPGNLHVIMVNSFSRLNAIKTALGSQLMVPVPGGTPAAPRTPAPRPDPCQDESPNCDSYDPSVCTDHKLWSTTNCLRTCGFCTPGPQTVALPCVDKLTNCSDYSVTSCGGTDKAWAMENCRESCGYCSHDAQTGGFFEKCLYKGAQYRQGDKWDDGCEYECECTDASRGQYVCYNKCPSYYNLPDECTLVQQSGKCCLEPVCNFNRTYLVKDVPEACVFNRRTYQQGEVWSVGCGYDCVCVDSRSGFYTCQAKCPQYRRLPSNCKLVKAPGECCEKPVCEFQPQVGTVTGGGGVTWTGVVKMKSALDTCADKRSDCSSYGSDLCTSEARRSFALDNCRKSCNLCNQGETPPPSPGDACVFKGQSYNEGETWYDGCSTKCTCDNAAFGYVRCYDECPEFLNLPAGCSMVTVAGRCCRSLFCDHPATIIYTKSGTGPGLYRLPKPGVYPTLPAGKDYEPGQNPMPPSGPYPTKRIDQSGVGPGLMQGIPSLTADEAYILFGRLGSAAYLRFVIPGAESGLDCEFPGRPQLKDKVKFMGTLSEVRMSYLVIDDLALEDSGSIICRTEEGSADITLIVYDLGPPRDLEVEAMTEERVKLSWKPPLEHPELVRGYTVQGIGGGTASTAVDRTITIETSGTGKEETVLLGVPTGDYSLRVFPNYVLGEGDDAVIKGPPVQANITDELWFFSVLSVRAVSLTPEQVLVTYKVVPDEALPGLDISYTSETARHWTHVPVDGKGSPVILTKLQPGTTYMVRAEADLKFGRKEVVTYVVTPPSATPPPTDVVVVSGGVGTFYIRWTHENTDGVEGYIVTVEERQPDKTYKVHTEQITPVSNQDITVRGISNEGEYRITVRAFGLAGLEQSSQPVLFPEPLTETGGVGDPTYALDVRAMEETPTRLQVMWSLLQGDLSRVIKYQILVTRRGKKIFDSTVGKDQRSVGLSHLPRRADLNITCKALDCAGYALATKEVDVKLSDGDAVRELHVEVNEIRARQARLFWSLRNVDPTQLKNIKLLVRRANGAKLLERTVSADTRTFSLSRLPADTSLYIVVEAIDESDQAVVKAALTFKTPASGEVAQPVVGSPLP